LGRPTGDPGQQVEEQKGQVTQPIFDVVAEDPQVKQVADDVEPTAVEEHRGQAAGQQRRQIPLGPVFEGPGRHEAKGVHQAPDLAAQGQLVDEGRADPQQ
jgi:hypothetical protein